MSRQLLEPILTKGIQNPYFFDGRLLRADDLRAEQDANRDHHEQLGLAVGGGVVTGLWVTKSTLTTPPAGSEEKVTLVKVTAGLAFNRLGQALQLHTPTEVALTPETGTAVAAGLFDSCEKPVSADLDLETNVYIFAVAPASGYQGSAPMRGLDGGNGTGNGCGSGYAVEGVQFKLVAVDEDEIEDVGARTKAQLDDLVGDAAAPARASRLRSLLAHLCFGSEELRAFAAAPFTEDVATYGLLDQLRADDLLAACDVPLALVYWDAGEIQFIDVWAVRRRLIAPAGGELWPLHVSQRRTAEAEAIFLQFQAQLDGLDRSTARAKTHFRFLPPAGYLPTGTFGFDAEAFFQGLDVERDEMDPAFLRWLVHQSWFLPPIDLHQETPPPIRLYRAPDNPDYLLFVRAPRPGEPPAPPEPEEPEETEEPEEPAPAPHTGKMLIDLIVKAKDVHGRGGEAEVITLADAEEKTRSPAIREKLRAKKGAKQQRIVWAEGPAGTFDAQLMPTGRSFDLAGKRDAEKGAVRFVIPTLPAGPYTVWAEVPGFKTASRTKTVKAGHPAYVTFKLVPESKKPGRGQKKPDKEAEAGWLNEWYGTMIVVDEYVAWPWPPDGWEKVDPLDDPLPIEARPWLEQWTDWVRAENPEAPLDPGDVRVYVDPKHTPDAIAEEPYAYLVFGEGGTYVPLALTGADQTFARPVLVTEGDVPAIDRAKEMQFIVAGKGELDVVGALWTGAVADVMRVSSETARSVIGEVRDRVAALLQPENSLRTFGGVDADLETTFKDADIDDDVALANADLETLRGLGLSEAFARRLLDEARQAVPESAWSLRTKELGLKDEEITALENMGVKTQGALKQRATDAPDDVAGALNVDVGVIDGLKNRIDLSRTDVFAGRMGARPVTGMFGVNRSAARTLAARGLGTLGNLAREGVKVEDVAAAFGGDRAKATEVIERARTIIGQ